MMRYLIPRVEFARWGGDGMHSDDNALTFVNGRCVEFAWLGLHFEFVIALERRP
jgi:hypothetical protein